MTGDRIKRSPKNNEEKRSSSSDSEEFESPHVSSKRPSNSLISPIRSPAKPSIPETDSNTASVAFSSEQTAGPSTSRDQPFSNFTFDASSDLSNDEVQILVITEADPQSQIEELDAAEDAKQSSDPVPEDQHQELLEMASTFIASSSSDGMDFFAGDNIIEVAAFDVVPGLLIENSNSASSHENQQDYGSLIEGPLSMDSPINEIVIESENDTSSRSESSTTSQRLPSNFRVEVRRVFSEMTNLNIDTIMSIDLVRICRELLANEQFIAQHPRQDTAWMNISRRIKVFLRTVVTQWRNQKLIAENSARESSQESTPGPSSEQLEPSELQSTSQTAQSLLLRIQQSLQSSPQTSFRKSSSMPPSSPQNSLPPNSSRRTVSQTPPPSRRRHLRANRNLVPPPTPNPFDQPAFRRAEAFHQSRRAAQTPQMHLPIARQIPTDIPRTPRVQQSRSAASSDHNRDPPRVLSSQEPNSNSLSIEIRLKLNSNYFARELSTNLAFMELFANLIMKEYRKDEIDFERITDYVLCFEIMKESYAETEKSIDDIERKRSANLQSGKTDYNKYELKLLHLQYLIKIIDKFISKVKYGIFLMKTHQKDIRHDFDCIQKFVETAMNKTWSQNNPE